MNLAGVAPLKWDDLVAGGETSFVLHSSVGKSDGHNGYNGRFGGMIPRRGIFFGEW